MNSINELWSLPWHALQKDLARELAVRTASSVVTVKNRKATLVNSNSWLLRARTQVVSAAKAT